MGISKLESVEEEDFDFSNSRSAYEKPKPLKTRASGINEQETAVTKAS